MTGTRQLGRAGRTEFVALIAFSVALSALGVDMILPALSSVRADLGLPPDSTAVAGLLTAYFLGMALGPPFYGPASDRFGRRPTLYVGFAIYTVGALAAAVSPTLPLLLASRLVWGIGAAGARVVTIAAIRDSFEGDRMSRTMSFVMAVFILVPVVAPSLGAAVVAVGSWRWVFGACIVAAVAMSLWALRLPETLAEEHRIRLSFGGVARAARHVVADRHAVGYGLAMTAMYGAFLSYLASSEIIIGRTFGRPGLFPVVFGGLALVMGCAMLANARAVSRVGTRRLAHGVLLAYVALAAALLGVAATTGGRPPLWLFMVAMAVLLSGHAMSIPNLNTIAMTNMGPVAGTASALIGATQMAVGALLGAVVDQAFAGTILPLAVGYLGYGVVALGLVLWAEQGRLFQPLAAVVDPPLPPTVAEG